MFFNVVYQPTFLPFLRFQKQLFMMRLSLFFECGKS